MMRYNTNQFTYDRETKNFIAEASDLQRVGKPLFGQVYLNACDEGFTLVSEHTGREANFFVHEVLSRDGEVQVWILRPTPETLRQQPYLADVEVHILND